MTDRKKDHIDLAIHSQTSKDMLDTRFDYEPVLSAYPVNDILTMSFLGCQFRAPLWVSSMTGGTQLAARINKNLAHACKDFGFGMGLGSCRSLLNNNTYFSDFDLRDIIGDDLPLFANLGICQIEDFIANNNIQPVIELVKRLRASGLIVHVNPLQEWFQREGDSIKIPPVDTISRLLDKVDFPIIVKEVGQGMGPQSISALLKLPLAAFEFAAFGGTNFSKIESLRHNSSLKNNYEPLALVGADVYQMLENVNNIAKNDSSILCKQIIISGGIKTFLDGYYFTKKSILPAIYGQANSFLEYARGDYEKLHAYVADQIKGLEIANAYLRVR